jgi:starch synthase
MSWLHAHQEPHGHHTGSGRGLSRPAPRRPAGAAFRADRHGILTVVVAPERRPAGSWWIANPGSIPELGHFAAWLTRQGHPVTYVGAAIRAPGGQQRLIGRLRRPFAVRSAPGSPDAVHSVATVAELAALIAARLRVPPRVQRRLLDLKSSAFDRAAARLIRRANPAPAHVLVRSTAARRTLAVCAARGIPSVLDYPITHHAQMRDLLQVEGQAHPELRLLSALDHRSPGQLRRLDDEVALAGRVLVLSDAHRRSFVDSGVAPDRLVQVELGVDTSVFRPWDARVDPPRDLHHVLFVGQLMLRKGVPYLLDTMRALGPDFRLTVVAAAGPDLRRDLEREGIEVVPTMSRDQLGSVYRQAGVFLFPTLAEGFPQTPLEAMACGLPVVVSEQAYGADGPVRDGVNGFVRDARDVEGLAEAVRACVQDQDTHVRLGAAAAATATTYTWERFGERLFAAAEARSGEGA